MYVAVSAPVIAECMSSSVTSIDSSPNVTFCLNLLHHTARASVSLKMRANWYLCFTPMYVRYLAMGC